MFALSPCRRAPRNGFTLVELLVTMAVLTLLVLAVAQIVSSTGLLTTQSHRRMDTDAEARAVFDRIDADLAGLLKRADVDYVFAKAQGNDALYFYSETPAYFSGSPAPELRSPLSLVGYRVNSRDLPTSLERLGKGLTWGGAASGNTSGAAIFLTFPPLTTPYTRPDSPAVPLPESTFPVHWRNTLGSAPGYSDGVDPDFHALSSAVFRLEYCFQLKNGQYSDQPFTAPRTRPEALQDVSSLIVAIALLDQGSQQMLTPAARSMTTVAPVFEDFTGKDQPAASTELMAAKWQRQINSGDFANRAGLPVQAAAGVRVYQRSFYLNTR